MANFYAMVENTSCPNYNKGDQCDHYKNSIFIQGRHLVGNFYEPSTFEPGCCNPKRCPRQGVQREEVKD